MTEKYWPMLMSHPEHGKTHVYADSELEERLKRGWAIEGLDKQAEDTLDSMIPAVSLEEMRDETTPKRKPGRPRKVQ